MSSGARWGIAMYLDYSEPKLRAAMLTGMSADGDMVRQFGTAIKDFSFDADRYNFREFAARHLAKHGFLPDGVPLEQIHTVNSEEDLTVDSSGQSRLSSSLYSVGDGFQKSYFQFIKEVVRGELFNFDFYFQTVPTFRCSVPGSPGYDWRPNYHTDIAIGHPPSVVNFWVPVTDCRGNNSLIYADLKDSVEVWRRYDCNFKAFHETLDRDDALFAHCMEISRSYDAQNGRGLAFDARCMHLHQKNDTDASRVSFDFRILSVDAYNSLGAEFVGTGRRGAQFRPGGYYHEKSVDQL